MMKRLLLVSMVLAVCCLGIAFAADYPDRDLQGIIMWGAGGATDNVARAITPLVEPYLGKQIVLINKPGGTGAISTQYVYSRPSDGYTLLYGAENPQLHGVLKLSKLDYKDFYPVNILARGVGVIVANNDTPWNSFKELIEDAKKRPGQIKMGSTGPGGLPYTVGAMIQAVTGFDVIRVPFDGEGLWTTKLAIEGPAGNEQVSFPVEVTPPGVGWIGTLACLLPFAILGLLWWRGMRRQRSRQ